MTYKYWNSGNEVANFRVRNVPEHDIVMQDFNIKSFKVRAVPLNETPSEKELCRPLVIFHWLFKGSPPPKSWYFTPCCGLEVQNLTQALQSVKGPANTFDLHSRWERTLPSLVIFPGIFIGSPLKNSNIKIDIWHPAVCLRCRITPRHFSQLKASTIPLT